MPVSQAWTWIVCGLLLLWPLRGWAGLSSVRYRRHVIQRIPVHVIIVDLRDRQLHVTPRLASGRSGLQTFARFHAISRPLAQMNGGFFDPAGGFPIGDIVVNWQLCAGGFMGTALAITPDNRVRILDTTRDASNRWEGYEGVMQGGIRLLQNGKWALSPRDQGFRDPAVYQPSSRTAVGLQSEKDLLLVVVQQHITLSQLTLIMKALGSWEAMALDGGSSVGLAYRRTILLNPRRGLVSVLTVVRRQPSAARSSRARRTG